MQAPLHLLSPSLKDGFPCDSLTHSCWESLQHCLIYSRILSSLSFSSTKPMEAVLLKYNLMPRSKSLVSTCPMSSVWPSKYCWLWSSLTLWDWQCCSAGEAQMYWARSCTAKQAIVKEVVSRWPRIHETANEMLPQILRKMILPTKVESALER